MIRSFCDRCGVEIPMTRHTTVIIRYIDIPELNLSLCDDCTEGQDEFLRGER